MDGPDKEMAQTRRFGVSQKIGGNGRDKFAALSTLAAPS